MYNISKTVRITQKYQRGFFKNKWTIYDTSTAKEIEIDYAVYLFLKDINEHEIADENIIFERAKQYIFKSADIVKRLMTERVIVEDCKKICNCNILSPMKVKFPLTKLIIELTNACNLRCVHCYGKFGENKNISFITFKEVQNLKSAMDELHTKSVALTGGEAILNKEFEKIALFFLENGFKLTIFTNGYETEKIKSFLEKTENYRYNISVSLDGNEECHNCIRGNENSFRKTINTLNILKSYSNITTSISTTVMRYNYNKLNGFSNDIKNAFPNINHQYTLMMPNADEHIESFDTEEFDNVYGFVPEAFMLPQMTDRRYRCRGGITGGSLSSNGNIKICNAAPDLPQFVMGNIYERGLKEIWSKPSQLTLKYRKERPKHQEECKKCRNKKTCISKNCRLYAYGYKKNENSVNPVNCYVEKRGNR